jgi:hypothetical protein
LFFVFSFQPVKAFASSRTDQTHPLFTTIIDSLGALSHASNLRRLQPHFKKFFTGISTIIINDDETAVLGCTSVSGLCAWLPRLDEAFVEGNVLLNGGGTLCIPFLIAFLVPSCPMSTFCPVLFPLLSVFLPAALFPGPLLRLRRTLQAESEEVQFSTPVNIEGEKINVWLTNMEKEISVSLASLLGQSVKALTEIEDQARAVLTFPLHFAGASLLDNRSGTPLLLCG